MALASSDLLVLISIGFVQLLAVISPGPSFLLTAQTAVAQSRIAGVKVALGLGAGTVVWACASFLGLSALFKAFPLAFIGAKFLGAAFILWIAYKIFKHAAEPLDMGDGKAAATGNPFFRGFVVQITNPKVFVFFSSILVAMLPADAPGWMMAALVVIVTFNEVWWYTVVALFFGSGAIRRFYLKAKVWIDRVTGLFLGALGLRLLWNLRDLA